MAQTKRRKKQCGASRKIDKLCIVRMSVTEYTSRVGKVWSGTSQHTLTMSLTSQSCKHLPLPPSVKEIQRQFAGGVSMEKIIDSKQQEVTNVIYMYIQS